MQLHLRLPARLVPMPGSRLDLAELEDWIVGAFCVLYQKVHGRPPSLAAAAQLSGRSEKRVRASWERMKRKGWLGMAKVPHQYADRRFGKKWRIWLMPGSPLVELHDAKRERWVAVPQAVARFRSVLAPALYMLAHEQRVIDGAVTLTAGEAARVLCCDRSTARRLMQVVGMKRIGGENGGRAVYDLPILFERKESDSLTLYNVECAVHGNYARKVARLDSLESALRFAGVDSKAAIVHALTTIQSAGYSRPRLDLVLRLVEEQNRATLAGSPRYRVKLTMLLGSRLRTLVRRPAGMVKRELARVPQAATIDSGIVLRSLIESALTETCSSCSGDGLVLVTEYDGDGRGREVGAPCPDCRT
jgi:hypothetical protein